jgi:hypothetical protein
VLPERNAGLLPDERVATAWTAATAAAAVKMRRVVTMDRTFNERGRAHIGRQPWTGPLVLQTPGLRVWTAVPPGWVVRHE